MRIVGGEGKEGHIYRKIFRYKYSLSVALILIVTGLIMFAFSWPLYESLGLILIGVGYFISTYTYNIAKIWYFGAEGERIVLNELKKLDDDYALFRNIIIPPNEKDTDFVVIGPNGIFAIEAKNYTGVIIADGDKWFRKKRSARGEEYRVKMSSNPSMQAKRSATALRDILNENVPYISRNRKKVWINAAVVFANKSAELVIKNPTVEILKTNELIGYITRTVIRKPFTESELEKIKEVITEACYK